MASGFGEHLKREREMRGVSLEEIAGATRISVRFLQALETEAWDRLPGGVFNRGFVRTVSRYLGLEEENLLSEYSLAQGVTTTAPPVMPEASPAKTVPKAALSAGPSNTSSTKIIFVVLAVAIPVIGGWYGWQFVSARRLEMLTAERALPSQPVPPAAPSSIWQSPTDSLQDPVSFSSTDSSDLDLRISATKRTSISISSRGQQIFAGSMAAGETRNIAARTALLIEAQDAGAIQIQLNGESLPPLGPPGRPGRLTIPVSAPKNDSGGHD